MLLFALLACHTIQKIEGDTGAETCGGPIYVAQAGFDTSDKVLADPDEPTVGSAPTPYHLHLSWSDDPSTTMAMIWRTDTGTFGTKVQYGLDDSYGSEASGASFWLSTDEADGRVHEVHLCDLAPATTYHYRVGASGGWSDDHTFTTAPTPGSDVPFRFAVSGDSRDNQATWALILDAMDTHAPDFYLFSGDAVDLGVDMAEWQAWFDAGEGHLESRPLMFAHGNHEFQLKAYYALVAQPGNEQWFSFDYANGHFVVLQDTVAQSGDLEAQATWMQTDLAATTAPWRFALHHQPAYSSCTTHGSNTELQDLWSPVEEAGGVALDITGHNHNYERSYPLRSGAQTTAEAGTTYVVAAGAGADLYGNDLSNAFTAVAATTENYVIVDVDGHDLTMTAYDLAGNVLDTFSTTR